MSDEKQPKNYQAHWTPEADAILLDCLKRGLPRQEIADLLHRSPKNIYERGRILKNGGVTNSSFNPDLFSPEFHEKFMRLYKEGVAIRQMAKELEVATHTITNLINTRVKEKRSRKIVDKRCHPQEIIDKIRHLYVDKKMLIKDIARELQVKSALVADICNRHKFRKGIQWTPEKEALLVEMLDCGKSFDDVSVAVERTKSAICAKLIKMNIYNRYEEVKKWYNNARNTTTLEQIVGNKLSACKYRAFESKIVCNLTKEFLIDLYHKQDGKCYYSGRALGFMKGDRDNLSVDRIDSLKGYEQTNVVLCCAIINVMKNSLTTEDLINYCHSIAKIHPKV